MSDKESLSTTEQSSTKPEWPEYDEACRLSQELLDRLGLGTGYLVFNIDDDKYSRVDISYDRLGAPSFTLHSVPAVWGDDPRGGPYSFQRRSLIGRRDDGNFDYGVTDTLYYTYYGSKDIYTDSELSGDSVTIEVGQSLPAKVSSLIADVSRLLPDLNLDQYDEDESEPNEEVDPIMQAQLEALERELHTAIGALGLFQLALLEKLKDSAELAELSADRKPEIMFRLSDSKADSYRVTAWHDPTPGEQEGAWYPHFVTIERSRQAHFHSGQILETDTHTFNRPGHVGQEVKHDFWAVLSNEIHGGSMTLSSYERTYQAGETLEAPLFVLARHALRIIVDGEIVGPESS